MRRSWTRSLPSSVPALPTRQKSQAARRSGFGTGVQAAAGRQRTLRSPRTPPPRTYARGRKAPGSRAASASRPLKVPAGLARGDDVTRGRRAPVTSEANGGGGAGALAGRGSAEKALGGSASAAEVSGGGRGPGGGSRGGRRSRASSHPGGQVSGGSEPSRLRESLRASVSPRVKWESVKPWKRLFARV